VVTSKAQRPLPARPDRQGGHIDDVIDDVAIHVLKPCSRPENAESGRLAGEHNRHDIAIMSCRRPHTITTGVRS
jgi:hypothetical protein